MTRLTVAIKEQIVNNALKQAGIFDEKKSLRSRRVYMAEGVRVYGLGGVDALVKLEKNIKHIKSLQAGDCFKNISKSCFGTHGDFEIYNCKIGGANVCIQYNGNEGRNDYGHVDRLIKNPTPYNVNIPADHPLAVEFNAIQKVSIELKDRSNTIKSQVKGSLSQYTTIKKLIEAWPEVKELLPKTVDESKPKLPVVLVKDLNKLIGLPKGEK